MLPGVHLGGTLAHQMTPIGLACLSNPQGSIAVPAKAGDIVVFSSLTPHRTGPNLTDQTRRAYILQYASDGCRIHTEAGVMEANDPDRQFYVEP